MGVPPNHPFMRIIPWNKQSIYISGVPPFHETTIFGHQQLFCTPVAPLLTGGSKLPIGTCLGTSTLLGISCGTAPTGVGKCPNWTSPNYWGYNFQQIFEGDVQNPQRGTFTNPWPMVVQLHHQNEEILGFGHFLEQQLHVLGQLRQDLHLKR